MIHCRTTKQRKTLPIHPIKLTTIFPLLYKSNNALKNQLRQNWTIILIQKQSKCFYPFPTNTIKKDFSHSIIPYIHLKDKNKDEDAENTIPVRSSFKYISRHHRIDFLFFLLKSQKVFYKCIVIQGNVNLAFIQNIPIRLPLLLILLSVCRHTRGSVCTWNVPSL